MKGKCKFGSKCRNSHDLLEIYIMRHAQSEYNEIVDRFEHDAYSEEAKEKYQLD